MTIFFFDREIIVSLCFYDSNIPGVIHTRDTSEQKVDLTKF